MVVEGAKHQLLKKVASKEISKVAIKLIYHFYSWRQYDASKDSLDPICPHQFSFLFSVSLNFANRPLSVLITYPKYQEFLFVHDHLEGVVSLHFF